MSSFMNEDKVKQLIKISNTCDNSLLNDLIDLFASETLRLISEIKVATGEKSILKIHKSARSLKLGADYIGAKKLYEISDHLEKEASKGHIPRNIETIINELEYYYCQSSEFLDKKKVA